MMWSRVHLWWRVRSGRAVARPQSLLSRAMDTPWATENVVVLGEMEGLLDATRILHAKGAHVEFRLAITLQHLYQLPLEQYSTVIMGTAPTDAHLDVMDIGGIIRRADPSIRLIWASTLFKVPQVADEALRPFCDTTLNLPCSEVDLAFAFGLG
jgi:hypothetical protein